MRLARLNRYALAKISIRKSKKKKKTEKIIVSQNPFKTKNKAESHEFTKA